MFDGQAAAARAKVSEVAGELLWSEAALAGTIGISGAAWAAEVFWRVVAPGGRFKHFYCIDWVISMGLLRRFVPPSWQGYGLYEYVLTTCIGFLLWVYDDN